MKFLREVLPWSSAASNSWRIYSSICGKLCGISLWLLFSSWKAKFICYSCFIDLVVFWVFWSFWPASWKIWLRGKLIEPSDFVWGVDGAKDHSSFVHYCLYHFCFRRRREWIQRKSPLSAKPPKTGRILHGKRRKMMTLRSHVHWTSSSIRAQKPISAFRRSRITVYIRMNRPHTKISILNLCIYFTWTLVITTGFTVKLKPSLLTKRSCQTHTLWVISSVLVIFCEMSLLPRVED